MSYNGTVSCSYCGRQGHNRRTCPELKKVIAKRLEENPDDTYAKWQLEKQASGKIRRCTYCNKKGHNRRTCPELAERKHEWREKAAAWRLKFVKWCVENGVGPGALIEVRNWSNTPQLRMVNNYWWLALNHEDQWNTNYPAGAITHLALNLQRNTYATSRLPAVPDMVGKEHGYYASDGILNVISPVTVTEEMFMKAAPQWWKDGYDAPDELKERFKSRKSPAHYDNQFED